ncbi:trimeric LpxA-like protein [Lipomyces chichibuensis]|uniref:trimeric LpxA-like protein n=1 Tax=Lipomyces chichibuensis TaxID=1546026 RepID=UPI0033432AD1
MSRRQTRGEYIETESGNRISRKAVILGSQHILLGGRSTILPECVVRGDLHRPSSASSTGTAVASINIGRYSFLEKGVVIKPPFKFYKGSLVYYPLKIGNFVSIGANSIIEAATIGSYVNIGSNCVVGKFAIIKDCVLVLDGTVIPSTACIPPFAVVAGNPAIVVDELPESSAEVFERRARQIHALHGTTLTSTRIAEVKQSVFDDDGDEEFDLSHDFMINS